MRRRGHPAWRPTALPGPVAARRWTLAAAILGSSMAFIDGTVVNVALPAIQRDLHANASEVQWVIEAYALFLAALLLAGGAMGDRFGRRRIFMIGVGIFCAASMECALSTGVWELILARAVQGSLALFVVVEARTATPMLPLKLFRIRDFTGTNLLTLLLYAALGGGLFFFPLSLIQVQGYEATAAGAALLPFIAIMFLLSGWAGKLVDTYGAKPPLVIGPLIAAAGLALFTLPSIGGNYWRTFFPAVCVLGLGMAITVAPLTTTVMNSVGAELAGVASGVNNTVSRTAGLLAVAVFGIVMAHVFNATLSDHLLHMQASPELTLATWRQRQNLAGIVLPAGTDHAVVAAIRHVIGEAFIAGFRSVMWLCTALALLSALGAWLLIDGRARGPSSSTRREP